VSGTVSDGSLLLALPIAALAGLVSFLSPCVLPLVPGYLAYTTGMSAAEVFDEAPRRRGRLMLGAGLFVAGFTFVFVSAGVLIGGLGGFLLEHQTVLQRWLGALTIVLGLSFIGLLPWLQRDLRLDRRPAVGLVGAPLLGVVFGLGWSPCLGPTLAAVFALGLGEGTAARGGVLAVAYCIGLGLPFLLAALAFSRAMTVFGWFKRHYVAVMRVGGGMLVVIGVLLVTGVWDSWVQSMQVWVNGFTVAV
jgi:cytochrome c-type biogenesis protein